MLRDFPAAPPARRERALSEVVDLFLELAAIPSPSGRERAVADRVSRFLADLRVAVHEDDAGPRIGSDCGNLIATIPATQVDGRGTPIFLCAHLDTVPPAPGCELLPVVENGSIRNAGGTILGADNKASVAVMLEAVRRIVVENRPHAGIELLLTLQEETTLAGARVIDLDRVTAQVGFVYDQAGPIGEIIVGAPHQTGVDLVFHGRAAHAGMFPEDGRSAIMAAARAIAALPHGRIDPETTANVGVIQGGSALNVVADRCAVRIDLRSHDESRLAALIREVLDTAAWCANEAGCTLESTVYETCPGYRMPPGADVVRLAQRGLAAAGFEPRLAVTGGGADTNELTRRGRRCITLSNGMAEIHTADEHIAVADLEAMVEVTLALIESARAGGF